MALSKQAERALKERIAEKIGELNLGDTTPDEIEEKVDEAFDELDFLNEDDS